ncbi:unnamed protein product [Ectocarpus sp. 12 AP-2014]
MTLTKPSGNTRVGVLSATPDLVPFPLPWALVPAARPRHPVVDRLRRHQSPMDVLQNLEVSEGPSTPGATGRSSAGHRARTSPSHENIGEADCRHLAGVGHRIQEYVRSPAPARSCQQDPNAEHSRARHFLQHGSKVRKADI